jgi:transposase
MKTSELSPEQRAQIVVLSKNGMPQVCIAAQIGVSQQVVSYTLKSYKSNGSYSSAQRSGRPRVTTKRCDTMIRRVCSANPTWSAKEISQEILSPPSVRTIQRRLHDEFNLIARRPAKKPLLSSKNIKDRIAFCRKYRHWTVDMWAKVLFTDESMFHQFNVLRQYVRRPVNKRYDVRYTQPTVKHSPSIMVWGSFSGAGKGNLHFLPKGVRMNAALYCEMLHSQLPPAMERLGSTILQQDGAPCHTAKATKNWLRDNNVHVLDWPGQSPDLNPIENLWQMMKRKIAQQQPSSIPHLKAIITNVWENGITAADCKKLSDSMPSRVQAVLQNNGGPCKY